MSTTLLLRQGCYDNRSEGAHFLATRQAHWRGKQAVKEGRILEENARMQLRLVHTQPYVAQQIRPKWRTKGSLPTAATGNLSALGQAYRIAPNSLEESINLRPDGTTKKVESKRPTSAYYSSSSSITSRPPSSQGQQQQRPKSAHPQQHHRPSSSSSNSHPSPPPVRPSSAMVHSSLPDSPYVYDARAAASRRHAVASRSSSSMSYSTSRPGSSLASPRQRPRSRQTANTTEFDEKEQQHQQRSLSPDGTDEDFDLEQLANEQYQQQQQFMQHHAQQPTHHRAPSPPHRVPRPPSAPSSRAPSAMSNRPTSAHPTPQHSPHLSSMPPLEIDELLPARPSNIGIYMPPPATAPNHMRPWITPQHQSEAEKYHFFTQLYHHHHHASMMNGHHPHHPLQLPHPPPSSSTPQQTNEQTTKQGGMASIQETSPQQPVAQGAPSSQSKGDSPSNDKREKPASPAPSNNTSARPRSAQYQPALAMETFSNGARRYSSRNAEFIFHASKEQQRLQAEKAAMERAAAIEAHYANYNSHLHYQPHATEEKQQHHQQQAYVYPPPQPPSFTYSSEYGIHSPRASAASPSSRKFVLQEESLPSTAPTYTDDAFFTHHSHPPIRTLHQRPEDIFRSDPEWEEIHQHQKQAGSGDTNQDDLNDQHSEDESLPYGFTASAGSSELPKAIPTLSSPRPSNPTQSIQPSLPTSPLSYMRPDEVVFRIR